MKRIELFMLSFLALAVAGAYGQKHNEQKQGTPTGTSAPSTGTQDRGQQVFAQNCSRCHNAPEGFSNHISGTVARHMRVRANLSDADYKALLKFLNP